ncbi:heavy-metal-associated domain-containing protein [Mediterranea massiliensis]|uniref:heavy-metal-associated domain-containing protein n=1 Tax=Mediterranea massiliensis TaxID=1841865 RepID=UPI0023F104D1|nr:heavy-metal-associated domain-containing protein [Mediterranea massiliensis]
MKRVFISTVLILLIGLTPAVHAKKKEKVVFLVSMTCENCKQRIEENLAFEKGVIDLQVDLSKKLVYIEYRPEKTDPQTLRKALLKLGYAAAPFSKKDKTGKHEEQEPSNSAQ